MFNQNVQPEIDMSEKTNTRRKFIKDSVSKSLLAVNAGIIVGLINTPGVANASGGGTTQPGTTATLNDKWTDVQTGTVDKEVVAENETAALLILLAQTPGNATTVAGSLAGPAKTSDPVTAGWVTTSSPALSQGTGIVTLNTTNGKWRIQGTFTWTRKKVDPGTP
jgi:hypothetical protein